MAVLKTRSSPKRSANVAASRNTPPNLCPTSCPYNKASGWSSINSRIAKRAASTINIFSAFAGALMPFSSMTGVGTKT